MAHLSDGPIIVRIYDDGIVIEWKARILQQGAGRFTRALASFDDMSSKNVPVQNLKHAAYRGSVSSLVPA